MKLTTYACRLHGCKHETNFTTTSRGKAASAYLSHIRDPCPDVKYTDIRVRSLGECVTSNSFRRTAEYRGCPFAFIGMFVLVCGHRGHIVGNNSSANFDVLFESGPWKGQTLNCHPRHETRFFDNDGTERFPLPRRKHEPT